MNAEWTGPECFMCNGTGRDRTAVTEPHGPFARVVGHVENGRRCRACNGHGRDSAGGETPAAATESAPVSGGASGMIRGLAHTRETPAKARTDRGRGPTFKESNVNDRTPKPPPLALTVARAQARALLTSTDPAVHSALLDALVRAGVLTEDRERLVRACGCIANEEPAACCDPLASPHWERRLVTPWEVAP